MTERNFDFLMPSVNFFGPGVISKIGERAKTLGMHKPSSPTNFLKVCQTAPLLRCGGHWMLPGLTT